MFLAQVYSQLYIKVGMQICRYALTIIENMFTLWIRRYVVSEYPRIHLSLGAALKWQGILQLSRFCTT